MAASLRPESSPQIAIFTDEPGWHGRNLKAWFAGQGLPAQFISLKDCHVDLANSREGLVIPHFESQIPRGAFVRGIPGGSLEEIVLRLDFLHVLHSAGCAVFNNAETIERTVDKARTSLMLRQQQVPTPRTFVSENNDRTRSYLSEALADGRTQVKKPLFGSQGKGLSRITDLTEFNALLPGEVAYLQDFVAPIDTAYRDYRVMVVDGRAVAAMERISHHWITNRAQGADCAAVCIDEELAHIAVRAAAAVGADYAGVDLLRGADGVWLVTEVNGIPAWQGLQRASGIDVTDAIGQAFMRRLGADRFTASG